MFLAFFTSRFTKPDRIFIYTFHYEKYAYPFWFTYKSLLTRTFDGNIIVKKSNIKCVISQIKHKHENVLQRKVEPQSYYVLMCAIVTQIYFLLTSLPHLFVYVFQYESMHTVSYLSTNQCLKYDVTINSLNRKHTIYSRL